MTTPPPNPKPNQPYQQPMSAQQQEGAKVIETLKTLENGFMLRVEVFAYQVRVIHAKYTVCKEQGFTEEQALQLCLKDWTS
jgi:hypothetical protein